MDDEGENHPSIHRRPADAAVAPVHFQPVFRAGNPHQALATRFEGNDRHGAQRLGGFEKRNDHQAGAQDGHPGRGAAAWVGLFDGSVPFPRDKSMRAGSGSEHWLDRVTRSSAVTNRLLPFIQLVLADCGGRSRPGKKKCLGCQGDDAASVQPQLMSLN